MLNDNASLERQLSELDASVQALGAIGELLCMCPPNHRVNANALGHLLHLVYRDMANSTAALDSLTASLMQSHTRSHTHSPEQG
jgi:hypothetical protein